MAVTTFKLNQAGVRSLFYSEGGPVQKDLGQKAERTASLARRLAPRGETGNLGKNIVVRRTRARGVNGWSVICLVDYAYFVHEGTRPHLILPRNAQALRWVNPGGEVVFAARARHPGTKPQPFLTASLGFIIR